MTEQAFALLGLGAPGRDFRDQRYDLPGGHIGWIRWLDREWIDGDARPMASFDVPPETPFDPFRDELTDEWLDHCADAGRFVFFIEDPAPWADPQEAANAAADVAAGLLAFAAPLSQEFLAVELEAEWVQAAQVVTQDVQPRDSADWEPLFLAAELHQFVGLPGRRIEEIVSRIGPAMADGDPARWGIVPALAYHQLALHEFAFAPNDVRDVIAEPEAGPARPFERARAEESFHNTWKAIEAALGGELNKDDVRLASKLNERGLDADSIPRFPDHVEKRLGERLRRLQGVRDRQAAHGGRTGVTRRVVTYFDLVEAQWMAAEVVFGILEAVVDSEENGGVAEG